MLISSQINVIEEKNKSTLNDILFNKYININKIIINNFLNILVII